MNHSLNILVIQDAHTKDGFLIDFLKTKGESLSYRLVTAPDEIREYLGRGAWDLVLSQEKNVDWNDSAALRALADLQEDIPLIVIADSKRIELNSKPIPANVFDVVSK